MSLANEIGPFDGRTKPARDRVGLYKRITRKGNEVWSWWNGTSWGMYGSNRKRAIERGRDRRKISKHQHLPWYGLAK
jgi:hypothetical protein